MATLIVNGVIATIVATIVINGFKDKSGMIALGLFLFHPLWLIGAIRLGKPGSCWARFFYTERMMARAADRFPNADPGWRVARPAPLPGELTGGCAALALAALMMLASGLPASLLAGALLPALALTWRGWSPGRPTAAVLGTLASVGTLLFGLAFPDDETGNPFQPGGLLGAPVASVVIGALAIAGLVPLYRPASTAYFRSVVTRPPVLA